MVLGGGSELQQVECCVGQKGACHRSFVHLMFRRMRARLNVLFLS